MTLVKLQDPRLTQNSIPFLYTSNEHLETKVKNWTAFTITRKSEYFGVNLPKPCTVSVSWSPCNTEEGNQRRWGETRCIRGLRGSTVRVLILPKLTCRCHAVPIPTGLLFVGMNKLVLKFIWKDKGAQIAKTIWKENNRVGRWLFSHFQTSYNHCGNPGRVVLVGDRHADQWDRLKSRNSPTQGQPADCWQRPKAI